MFNEQTIASLLKLNRPQFRLFEQKNRLRKYKCVLISLKENEISEYRIGQISEIRTNWKIIIIIIIKVKYTVFYGANIFEQLRLSFAVYITESLKDTVFFILSPFTGRNIFKDVYS